MDGTVDVGDGDLDVVICVDEFGPLNLQPHPRPIVLDNYSPHLFYHR